VPIRWRLAAFGAGVAALAVLIFVVLLVALAASGVESDQDELLGERAERAVGSVEASDLALIVSGPSLLAQDIAVSDAPFEVVVGADGAVLYGTGLLAGDIPRVPAAVIVEAVETGASAATVNAGREEAIRMQARRWERPDLGEGVVIVRQAARVTEQQLAGLRVFLVISGVITVLAAAIAAWFVSGRALRPLNQAAATAEEIAETGDLSRRLPGTAVDDEVGTLSRNFNNMLDRLAATQQQLAESLDLQRRFVADASHELRTPLTTIRSNAGFLLDRPEASAADLRDATEDIAAEADRMTRLVGDLLTLARADSGWVPDLVPLDLRGIAESVARRARHLTDRLEVRAGGPVLVSGDRDSLSQVVWILLDNAVKHGAGMIQLDVLADEDAVLRVADDGVGIPRDDLDRVFGRFHRADAARSGEGSGLGLAIAHTIVEWHHGTIAAANTDGGGAEFTVRLPLLPAD
jgi:signal transduction histidine kinase